MASEELFKLVNSDWSDDFEEVGVSSNGGGDVRVPIVTLQDTWNGLGTLCICC